MTLRLDGLEVECVIGDLPCERERAQRLLVNVELEVSDRAAETDDLADAADYAALAERITYSREWIGNALDSIARRMP